jgi:hypothetical protein
MSHDIEIKDGYRQCIKCNKVLPIIKFRKHSRARDGFLNICKKCNNLYLKDYRAKFRDKRVVQNTGKKQCKDCNNVLPIGKFHIVKENKDGRSMVCKTCFTGKYASKIEDVVKVGTKQCRSCHEILPVTDFYITRTYKDGRNPHCKKCYNLRYKKKEKQDPTVSNKIIDDYKKCTKCKTSLPVEKFYKTKRNKSGITALCKKCINEYQSEYKKKISKINKIKEDGIKCCKGCHKILDVNEFYVKKRYKDGRNPYCKKCYNLLRTKTVKEIKEENYSTVCNKLQPKLEDSLL